MHEEPTIAIIQRYPDALPRDSAAEPPTREFLERAVGRLRLLCTTFLHTSYPRLAWPPVKAATVVGVSEKTVQRRLNRARFLLAERLADLRPGTSREPPPPGDTPLT